MLMKKIKNIFIIFILILLILSINIYARYNFTYNLKVFSLSRDNTDITYNITRTENDKKYTNQDVLLTINLNKPIDFVSGFEISEDGKKLTKLITQNENNTFFVEDISGNRKEITYSVDNIDKILPEILGVEDGKTYNTNMKVSYSDNIGVDEIFVDRYSSLSIAMYPDYYDTGFYKGINILDKSIEINLKSRPKNTKYYNYYLDGILKGCSENKSFNFTGLTPGTTYEVTVEALDENKNVIESITKSYKTKYFSSIIGTKKENTFTANISGIDNKVKKLKVTSYCSQNENKKITYPEINSDRSINVELNALELTDVLKNGYYYLHIEFFDEDYKTLYETVCCNIMFGTNYIVEEEIDVYNFNIDGLYQIIVTDLAGNKTEKNIIIEK